MSKRSDRYLMVLATANMLGFVVILILFWVLWNNKATLPDQNITLTYAPPEQQPVETQITRPPSPEMVARQPAKPEASVNAEDISKINAVAKEVMSNNLDTYERLDIKVPKISNKTSDGSRNAINSTLSDDEYIAVFNQLHTKEKPDKPELKTFTREEVSRLAPKKQLKPEEDHFNKVDLSRVQKRRFTNLSLAQQVAAVAVLEQDKKEKAPETTNDNAKNYLEFLQEEGAERRNEMRTIIVQQDDTLWNIAQRAYGSGFLYEKIFEANPHLTSPDSIIVGEVLRVPL